jgi:hypothetical protein
LLTAIWIVVAIGAATSSAPVLAVGLGAAGVATILIAKVILELLSQQLELTNRSRQLSSTISASEARLTDATAAHAGLAATAQDTATRVAAAVDHVAQLEDRMRRMQDSMSSMADELAAATAVRRRYVERGAQPFRELGLSEALRGVAPIDPVVKSSG